MFSTPCALTKNLQRNVPIDNSVVIDGLVTKITASSEHNKSGFTCLVRYLHAVKNDISSRTTCFSSDNVNPYCFACSKGVLRFLNTVVAGDRDVFTTKDADYIFKEFTATVTGSTPNTELLNRLGITIDFTKLSSWRNESLQSPLTNKELVEVALYCTDLQLEFANLEGWDLSGLNLQGAKLRFANLKNATLRETNCSDADMSSVNAERADCTGAKFCNANLNNAKFLYATLQDADLAGAQMRGIVRQDTNVQGTILDPNFKLLLGVEGDGTKAPVKHGYDSLRSLEEDESNAVTPHEITPPPHVNSFS